jgi:hypothetical protein
MLVSDKLTFIHIPKCGGTSVRRVLTGHEVSECWPMPDPSFTHPFHKIGFERPAGRVVTTIRRPDGFLASFWKMRMKRGGLEDWKPLDRLLDEDVNIFFRNVIKAEPDYIDRMFRAYLTVYDDIEVFRIEDGLSSLLGGDMNPHRNKLSDTQSVQEDLRLALLDANPWIMRFYA